MYRIEIGNENVKNERMLRNFKGSMYAIELGIHVLLPKIY